MHNDPIDVDAQFAILRQTYATELRGKQAKLSGLAAQLGSAPADQDTLEETRQMVHQIAGSGAIFGFAELGKAAKALDQQLDLWLNDGESVPPDVLDGISRLIQMMRHPA